MGAAVSARPLGFSRLQKRAGFFGPTLRGVDNLRLRESFRISLFSPAMPIKPDPISGNVPAPGAWLNPAGAVPLRKIVEQRINGPVINSAEKGQIDGRVGK
jgi:hypothetical protein